MPEARSFAGDMQVPVRGWDRFIAPVPRATLIVDDDAVTLRTRWFAVFTTGTFRVPLSAVAVAYPVRSRLRGGGIGLTTTDEQTAYFWARRAQSEILRTLAARGVNVDPAPRRPAVFRPQGSPAPSVTQVVELRLWLARTLPLFMALITVETVVELTSPASPWWHAYTVAVSVICVTAMFRLWRGSRRQA